MSWFRKKSLDDDPIQEQLGYLLIEAAVNEINHGIDDTSASVRLFVFGQGWPKKEAEKRLLHALSMLKTIPENARDRAALIAAKVIAED